MTKCDSLLLTLQPTQITEPLKELKLSGLGSTQAELAGMSGWYRHRARCMLTTLKPSDCNLLASLLWLTLATDFMEKWDRRSVGKLLRFQIRCKVGIGTLLGLGVAASLAQQCRNHCQQEKTERPDTKHRAEWLIMGQGVLLTANSKELASTEALRCCGKSHDRTQLCATRTAVFNMQCWCLLRYSDRRQCENAILVHNSRKSVHDVG